MEAEASTLLGRVTEAQAGGDTGAAIALITEGARFNITEVWKTSIAPLRTDLFEAAALKLKEEASSRADSGDWVAALNLLQEVKHAYPNTQVAQSDAVANLVHHCEQKVAE